METATPSFISRHTRVRISTERHTEFIDITDGLNALVREADVRLGVLNVKTLHTTTAIIVNEHGPLGPSSACLSVVDGALRLAREQRVLLVELDGPGDRDLSVLILGECGR